MLDPNGEAGSLRTIEFIEKWLGRQGAPSADRYRSRACALYSLYRPGLVHRRVPGTLVVDGGAKLTWVLDRLGAREDHLYLHAPGTEPMRGRALPADTLALRVSVDLLFRDLLGAFEAVRQQLHVDPNLASRLNTNREKLEGPRPLEGKQAQVRAKLAAVVASPDH